MVLITGATGRIGNVLVKEFNKRGDRVKVLVRENSNLDALEGCNCEFVYGDILSKGSIHLKDVSAVFHLAGHINITDKNREKTLETNIQGTKNIADLCIKNNIPLIYTSSIHAIEAINNTKITEQTPLALDWSTRRGIYDYSKAHATQYLLDNIKNGLQAIIVHPTGVIGPYDYQPSFFGQGMIKLIKSGIKTTISGKYDYVDVRDVVGGVLKAYDLNKYGERYILSGEQLDMQDYLTMLQDISGIYSKSNIIGYKFSMLLGTLIPLFDSTPEITRYSVNTLHSNCDISHEKATKELGYTPIDVKQSIRDQYLWFKQNSYI